MPFSAELRNDVESFPNLVRAMQQAEYVGWDGMFEQGLSALVRGLVLDRMPAK